jgi:hypothetical protein
MNLTDFAKHNLPFTLLPSNEVFQRAQRRNTTFLLPALEDVRYQIHGAKIKRFARKEKNEFLCYVLQLMKIIPLCVCTCLKFLPRHHRSQVP